MLKSIPDPGFSGDDGTADPTLAAALAAYAAGTGGAADVHRALAGRRVMVGVVAVAQEVDEAGVEKSTDMSVVTLRGSDGRTAMPAFTSLATLAAWYPQARPVPVEAERACLAAIAEGADLVVLDPAGPVAFPVEGPALRALAQGRVPVPPVEDPAVAAAARAAVEGERDVALAWLVPSDDADAVLALVATPGLGPDATAAVAQRVAARLAADPVLRERLDRGLDLALVPLGTAPAGVVLVDRLVG
jgi:hypothetical protein